MAKQVAAQTAPVQSLPNGIRVQSAGQLLEVTALRDDVLRVRCNRGYFRPFLQNELHYLRAKPRNPSLFDFLGPWPWYLAASEGIALGLFVLLYLPFWRPASNSTERGDERK